MIKYYPILKARDAELQTLASSSTSCDIRPVFEPQRALPGGKKPGGGIARVKSTVTDLSYFLDDVVRQWNGPSYVDMIRVSTIADRHAWWSLLDSLVALNPTPGRLAPVVRIEDSSQTLSAAARLASVAERVAVRISLPETPLVSIASEFARITSELGLTKDEVDVILDWKSGLETSKILLDDSVDLTAKFLTALNGLYARAITAGTPDTSTALQNGDWTFTRREWWLWQRLRGSGFDVHYGDYALYPPADPAPASPKYGHLRYSSGALLQVHRRSIPGTGGGLGAAFEVCATHLTGQSHYLSPSFSGADQVYSDIAAGLKTVKSPGAWRQLSFEHHLALVDSQLSSPLSPPPAGTP